MHSGLPTGASQPKIRTRVLHVAYRFFMHDMVLGLLQTVISMGNPSPRASSIGRYRWIICGLLFWVTTANYIDRGVFSNLAPELQKQFGWSDSTYWYMN